MNRRAFLAALLAALAGVLVGAKTARADPKLPVIIPWRGKRRG